MRIYSNINLNDISMFQILFILHGTRFIYIFVYQIIFLNEINLLYTFSISCYDNFNKFWKYKFFEINKKKNKMYKNK